MIRDRAFSRVFSGEYCVHHRVPGTQKEKLGISTPLTTSGSFLKYKVNYIYTEFPKSFLRHTVSETPATWRFTWYRTDLIHSATSVAQVGKYLPFPQPKQGAPLRTSKFTAVMHWRSLSRFAEFFEKCGTPVSRSQQKMQGYDHEQLLCLM